MTNFDDTKIFRNFLVSLIFVSIFPAKVLWATNRTFWVYEQYLRTPKPTLPDQTRYQFMGDLSHFSETMALRVHGLLDLRAFEIGLRGTQLLFPSESQNTSLTKEPLYDSRLSLGIEFARYFVTEKHHYGRFSFGGIHFFPERELWLEVGLDTGIVSSEERGWEFGVGIKGLFPTHSEKRLLAGQLRLFRELVWFGSSRPFSVGGTLSALWNTRGSDAVGVHEHLLLTLSPAVGLKVGLKSYLEAGVKFRLWMDRSLSQSSITQPITTTTFGELFAIPALFVNWNWVI